jgi:DNA-binding transcriptional ArsR family regulator
MFVAPADGGVEPNGSPCRSVGDGQSELSHALPGVESGRWLAWPWFASPGPSGVDRRISMLRSRVVRQLPHPDLADIPLERVLSALGDPIRLGMVQTLADGQEHLRGDFKFDIAQSTLSHHAKTLREAGIVYSRQEATRCFMSLRRELGERFPGLLDAVLAQARIPA